MHKQENENDMAVRGWRGRETQFIKQSYEKYIDGSFALSMSERTPEVKEKKKGDNLVFFLSGWE
jgi:hypothetical protein